MTQRSCLDCSTPISSKGKTGCCRPCAARRNHADSAFRARLEAASTAAKRTPESRRRASEAALRKEAARRNDPEWRAYKVASGQRLRAEYDASPEAQRRNAAKRKMVGRKIAAKRLGWLPPDRRREYENLRDKVGAPDAKSRILASMTPFERQLARVRGGAKVVEKFVPRPADHLFTLGGVAPEAM